mgnify:CR=1 FL=1
MQGKTYRFLPYLWGMETSANYSRQVVVALGSYRTYEEWKHRKGVNEWNLWLRSYRTYEEWKLCCSLHCERSSKKFLPYLWGMETNDAHVIMDALIARSYRTYEEWKRFSSCASKETPLTGSYRTYEEWKQRLCFLCLCFFYYVLTVPMRNGN